MAAVTYRAAGVNVEKVDRLLVRLGPMMRASHGPEVLPDLGQFAGLFRFPANRLRDPVLVASTDGVGTKLLLAKHPRDYAAIGMDAVAMNVNDLLVYGARPLFFLDYIAMGRLQPVLFRALLRGMAAGCRQSGCALLGGETAEMPGVYHNGEYDVAGFCVGVVERRKLIDGSRVRAGDVIIGLASSGVHANGFSLVRKALSPSELTRLKRQLLMPTRIYVKPVLAVAQRVELLALAHVTGGGLARRLPSLVSRRPRVRARWSLGAWPVPPIFRTIQRAGGIPDAEMCRTFNMGIGMAVVCRRPDAARVIRLFKQAGIDAWTIGTIERSS